MTLVIISVVIIISFWLHVVTCELLAHGRGLNRQKKQIQQIVQTLELHDKTLDLLTEHGKARRDEACRETVGSD